jgi:hypothetical protein
MQSKEKDDIVFIRLYKEENVNKKIKEACKKHNIKTAVVLSGIGQLKKITLGFFKDKGNYTPKEFDYPLELLSISGNICRDKEGYILHLHAVLGDEEKKAIGGHFIDGQISVTGEIVLLKTKINVKRKIDKETGLKNLFLE